MTSRHLLAPKCNVPCPGPLFTRVPEVPVDATGSGESLWWPLAELSQPVL